MIGMNLKYLLDSVVSSGIPNDASSVLFLNFVLEINFSMEIQSKVISIKTSETNQTLIVILKTNNTYLSKWFTTITNDSRVTV